MTNLDRGACAEWRTQLDSALNTSDYMLHPKLRGHLEGCPSCAAARKRRQILGIKLSVAVGRQEVPVYLRTRVRARMGSRGTRVGWSAGFYRWVITGMAGLAVCVAVWMGSLRWQMPALSDRTGQEAYIERVSTLVSGVLRLGLGDHIHCSVFRKYPLNPPTLQEMTVRLGPTYRGLLPPVTAAIPKGYRVIMAHQCGYAGRKYIHLTLRRDANLISLVISRKVIGESLPSGPAAAFSGGVSVYQTKAGPYQVAAFDAGQFFVYVVSDLHGTANLQIAVNVAPRIRDFLASTAG